ncbi:MAG TPA: pilus assembly protein TadG-related protein [Bryobacteraceae bacterium]|nr:pilus assembly protein TadG-related protein [Bryobacteraceae bacterium]
MHGRHSERGQAVILFTLSVIVMFGVLGLVVDIGWAYFRKQAAQAAADAAALAAVREAVQWAPWGQTCGVAGVACQSATTCPNPIPNPPTNNMQGGCAYAKENGFAVTTGGNQTVTMAGGTSGPPVGVTVNYWATAVVTETVPQTFSAILGNTSLTVSARATAGTMSGGGGGCIYVLNQTGTSVSGNGTTLLQTACGVYVNSTDQKAVTLTGGAKINATDGASVNITGNWSGNGNSTITPTPNVGVSATADPFSSLPAPSVGSCTSNGVSLTNQQTLTIDPGVYCGPITLGGQSSLTLNPGLYILKGGISVGAGANLSGSGVTLYNQSGSISMGGGGNITLTAPTSGTYKGVVIFQDKSNSSTASLIGGATQNISGLVYMPTASLTYGGGSSTSGTTTTLAVGSLSFSGNSYIASGAVTALGGSGPGISLIE